MSKTLMAWTAAALLSVAGPGAGLAAAMPASKPVTGNAHVAEHIRHVHVGGGYRYSGHRYGGYRYRPYAYGFVPGVVIYNSGPSYCAKLRWKAKETGSRYWWLRYHAECG